MEDVGSTPTVSNFMTIHLKLNRVFLTKIKCIYNYNFFNFSYILYSKRFLYFSNIIKLVLLSNKNSSLISSQDLQSNKSSIQKFL